MTIRRVFGVDVTAGSEGLPPAPLNMPYEPNAPWVQPFVRGFFGPAIESGAMTTAGAEFMAAGFFCVPMYRLLAAGRDSEALVFLGLGPVGSPSVGTLADEEFALEVMVDGDRMTLDREGVRRWAKRVERVCWPSDTLLGIVLSDELRAWHIDLAASLVNVPAPRCFARGPEAVARRRARLWARLGAEDRRATWQALGLEDLARGGHRVLQGLIVPGGCIDVPPFDVPLPPWLPEAQREAVGHHARQLDKALGVDREEPRTTRLTGETPPESTGSFRRVGGQRIPIPAVPPAGEPAGEEETAPDLSAFLGHLPRRERRLADLLRQGHDLTTAARVLGVQPVTARRMFARVKAKAARAR